LTLMHCKADVKIRIGDVLTKGMVAGDDAESGRHAAEEPLDELNEALKGARWCSPSPPSGD
jgi:cell division GTPase FtsZ